MTAPRFTILFLILLAVAAATFFFGGFGAPAAGPEGMPPEAGALEPAAAARPLDAVGKDEVGGAASVDSAARRTVKAGATGGTVSGRVLEGRTLAGSPGVQVRAMRRHPGFDQLEERFRGLFRGGLWKESGERVEVLSSAITGPGGEYEITGIPAGQVFLDARSDRLYSRTPLPLKIAVGEVRTGVDLVGTVGGRVRGVVLGPGGSPVARGVVTLRPGLNAFLGQITDRRYRWHDCEVDAGGRFDLPGVPVGKGYVLSATGPEIALEDVVGIEVEEGRTTEVTVRGRRGAAVSGIVVSPDGRPVAGANVALVFLDFSRLLFSADGREGPVLTAADGTFRVERVAPGRVGLTAVDETHAPAAVEELLLGDGTVHDGVRLELRDADAVSGVVADESGAPLPGVKVSVRGMERPEQIDLKLALNLRERVATTGEDGRFSVPGVFERRVFVEASKRGYVTERRMDIDRSKDPEVKLTLMRGSSIEGVVLLPDGTTPAQRFSVRVAAAPTGSRPAGRRRGGEWNRGGNQGKREEFQDAAGRFHVDGFRSGKVTVTVESEGYRAAENQEYELTPGEERKDLKFVLREGSSVSGVVVDAPAGAPVPEVMVTARRVRDDAGRGSGGDAFPFRVDAQPEDMDFLGLSATTGRGSVLTDPRGQFSIAGLEPGTYQITARHPDHTKSSIKDVVLTVESPTKGVEIVLGTGGIVEGTVTGLGARPLADALIVAVSIASGTLKSVTSDAGGRYRIEHLPPGQYVVFKSRMEERSENIMFDLIGNMRLKTAAVKDGKVTRVDIHDESEDGVRVHGTVSDRGAPVKNGMVMALASDRSGPFGIGIRGDATDPTGRYELPSLKPGTYFLQVTITAGRPHQTTVTVEVPSGVTDFRHDIELPTSKVAGRVVDSAGKPIERAFVRAGVAGGGDAPEGLMGMILRNGVAEARTDKDGVYELPRLAAGTYRLTASMRRGPGSRGNEEFGEASIDGVAVDGTSTLPGMDFVLPTAGRIAGVAVDGNGAPVTGAQVLFEREGDQKARKRDEADLFGLQVRSVRTDAEGRFVLKGLTPGTYSVTADQKGLSPGEQKGIVVAEGMESPARLVMLRGATLRVRVTDMSGSLVPIGSVEVLNSSGEPVTKKVTAMEAFRKAFAGKSEGDDSGWYELGNVKPDTYTAVVRRPGKEDFRYTQAVKDGEEISWEVSMKELEGK